MADPIKGAISSLEVSTDGGTTWTPVLGRTDMSLSLNRGEIDASHMDGGGWSNFLPGRRDWSISGTLRYIEEDPGQVIVVDNYFDETDAEIDIRFRLREATGANEFTGKGYVQTLEPAPSDEAPTDMSVTIRGNGALTKAEQAVA